MIQDTSATGGTSGWQPVCPLCGQLGYGWHNGTTVCDGHYFSPTPVNPYKMYIDEVKEEVAKRQDGTKII